MFRLSVLEWGEGAGEEMDLQWGTSPDLMACVLPAFVGGHQWESGTH